VSGIGHLQFSRAECQTIVTRSFATSPLKLLTLQHRSGSCWVYAATLGGGFVGGDAVDINMEVEEGAIALLTTQASTKVYRSLKPATQSIAARVKDEALLAIVPDPIVCFAEADFSQQQRYDLSRRGSLVVVDWITSGRHAVGERWAFARYNSRIQVCREGRLILFDAITLQRGTDPLVERMGRFDVFATCVITGPLVERAGAAIVTSIEQLPIEHRDETIESAYALQGGGAVLRIAGTSVEHVARQLRLHLNFLSPLLGDDPWMRKW
jgi:urease accessory protein